VTRVVIQGAFSGLGVNELVPISFTTVERGTLDVMVDWTFTEDNVEIYLGEGLCTIEEINAGACAFGALSESRTAKPERVALANAAPASYTLYIGNRGPREEAVSYVVNLTGVPGAVGRAVATGRSPGSAGTGGWLSLRE